MQGWSSLVLPASTQYMEYAVSPSAGEPHSKEVAVINRQTKQQMGIAWNPQTTKKAGCPDKKNLKHYHNDLGQFIELWRGLVKKKEGKHFSLSYMGYMSN